MTPEKMAILGGAILVICTLAKSLLNTDKYVNAVATLHARLLDMMSQRDSADALLDRWMELPLDHQSGEALQTFHVLLNDTEVHLKSRRP